MRGGRFSSILVVCALVYSGQALAGGNESGREVGNGGLAVVCRGGDGLIGSAEVLDLFEGKNQYNLRIPERKRETRALLEAALVRMASRPEFLVLVKRELNNVLSNLRWLPKGVELSIIDDAFPIITLKPCAFEQLAVYSWDGNVYVSSGIFGALTPTHAAALFMHEALYKVARDHGATNSMLARKLNAHLFSEAGDRAAINELVDELMMENPFEYR